MSFPLSFSKSFLKTFGKVVWPELLRREKVYSKFWKLHSTDKDITDIVKWTSSQISSKAAEKIVKDNGWTCWGIDNYDDVMRSIQLWVEKNIEYVPDPKAHKMDEYWQTVDETLQLRTGDCEDGAILICALAAIAGIPTYRYRLQWGEVIGGGHCYVVYYGDNDAVEKVIDWCYWSTSLVIWLRSWIGDDTKYGEVWGTIHLIPPERNIQ